MAIVIPACYPSITYPRWLYQRPCGEYLGIGVYCGPSGSKVAGGIKITGFGEEVRMWADSAGNKTTCVSGSTYLFASRIDSGSQEYYGAYIDVFSALRASVWSVSTVFTVLADNVAANVQVMAGATYNAGVNFNAGTNRSTTSSGATPDCTTLPGIGYTVTMYDSGNYTITTP